MNEDDHQILDDEEEEDYGIGGDKLDDEDVTDIVN